MGKLNEKGHYESMAYFTRLEALEVLRHMHPTLTNEELVQILDRDGVKGFVPWLKKRERLAFFLEQAVRGAREYLGKPAKDFDALVERAYTPQNKLGTTEAGKP